MAGKTSAGKIAAFGIVIALPIILLLIFSPTKNIDKNTRLKLPIFFPIIDNGDTSWHKVPAFEFTSHLGEAINNETFAGKIYITDFFYTTCKSICPEMTSNMSLLQKQFMGNKDVMFLSHTVDPGHDSVEVLKNYAEEKGVVPGKWFLVTGRKGDLYKQAREGYFISAQEGLGLPEEEDFIHSDRFILVDRNRNIRGTYNGTDTSAIQRLMTDIVLLLSEE